MRKVLFFLTFLIWGIGAQAQGDMRVGINAGIPVGDIEEVSSFQIAADLAWLFGVGQAFDVGPMVGYSHFFGEEVDMGPLGVADAQDFSFLPIALAGKLGLNESFYLGADLGYALGLTDGVDGGFYYRPKIGYDFGNIGLNVSYSGISVDGGSLNAVSAGIAFGL